MRRRALLVLAVISLVSCFDAVAPEEPSTDPGALYDRVWTEFDRHYAFFASRNVDWGGVRARHRPLAFSEGARLAICRTLDTLRDGHALLLTQTSGCGPPPLRRTYAFDPEAVNAPRYLNHAGRLSGTLTLLYGALGNVGYIRIDRFIAGGAEPAEVDAALASFGDVRGVVIDMRGNSGGNSTTAEAIAGRFADRAYPYLTTRFRDGPGHDDFDDPETWTVEPAGRRFGGGVAVLVDRSVGSAGEVFVMAMRVLPRVTTVGDTTSGNASNPLWRELPNGWAFSVPQSVETTIDGISPTIAGGLPPMLFVRTSTADSTAGIDTMLDSALAVVRR